MGKAIKISELLNKHAELYKYVKAGDFSGDLALIEEYLGTDIAFLIAAELSNISITIPKSGLYQVKKKYVVANFNGSNHKDLSIKCDISLSTVYRILSEDNSKSEINSVSSVNHESKKEQKTLFDF